MIDFSRARYYYIACGYTDMRKQIDGLAAVVQLQFQRELDETSLFLFYGRKADRMKALYWDGTGYVLLYKWLASKKVPVAQERARTETADGAGIPLAHGRIVHHPEEGLCIRQAGHSTLKTMKKS